MVVVVVVVVVVMVVVAAMVVVVVVVIETVTMLYRRRHRRMRTHLLWQVAAAPQRHRRRACRHVTQAHFSSQGGSARVVSQGCLRGQTFQDHLANHWQIHFHHRAAVAHVRKRSCMPVFKRLHGGGGGGGGWSVVADVLCNQVADVTTHLSRVSDVTGSGCNL
jgi:hypothetical protein